MSQVGRVLLVGAVCVVMLALIRFSIHHPPIDDEPAIEEGLQVSNVIRVTHPGLVKLKAVADAQARTAHLLADSAAQFDVSEKRIQVSDTPCDEHAPACPAVQDTSKAGLRAERDSAFRDADLWRRSFHHALLAYVADSIALDSTQHLLTRAAPAITDLERTADCRIVRLGPIAPRCLSRTRALEAGLVTGVLLVAIVPQIHIKLPLPKVHW